MRACKVCGEPDDKIMINRDTGICDEICRGIAHRYPEPQPEDGPEYRADYLFWLNRVRRLKAEAIDVSYQEN